MVREDANEAYVIGLRLNPDRAGPEWFTLWFEEPDGSSRMATRDGRVQWVSTSERAHRLRRPDQRLSGEAEVDGVCDVALVLHRLSNSETGDEGDVLTALNLLDDAVNTTELGRPQSVRVLDRLVVALTEGEPMDQAVASVGSQEAIEAVMTCLGCTVALSDFVVATTDGALPLVPWRGK